MFISQKRQIRHMQHTLVASVTKINRHGHRQMQYSEARPAPQRSDCMRQWTYELFSSALEVQMTDSADI